MKRILLTGNFMLIFTTLLNAQSPELISGNPKSLNGIQSLYVTFSYNNLEVGEYGAEVNYIEYMIDDAEKRKPGSGPVWKANWYAIRDSNFHPKFLELFNKYSKRTHVATNKSNAHYELNLHTTFMDPGFNFNGKEKPAVINVIVTISEIEKPEHKIIYSLEGIEGGAAFGFYLNPGDRFKQAYAKCGKELGKHLRKHF